MPSEEITNIDGNILNYIGDNELDDMSNRPILEVGDINTSSNDTIVPSLKKGDININNYLFDNNNIYANNNSGVEIDGFLFFPNEIKGGESYSRREYKRTKIMSGGEFVTRGQFMGREFSFTTTLDIDPNKPNMYDKIFQIMENKPCEIVSPYMGDIFNAEVNIEKTHPKASPGSLKLDIKIKEIVTPKTSVVGDAVLEYPSTTTLSENAINIRTVQKGDTEKDKDEEEKAQIIYDGLAKDKNGEEYHSVYGNE